MSSLSFTAVEKSFGSVRALTGVSLSARPGKVHAILGENGAGKSTLVRVLAGLVQPDSGDVSLGGAPLHFATPSSAERAGVGIAFQESSLIPHLTVAENLVLGSELDEPRFRRSRSLSRTAERILRELAAPALDVRRQVRTLSLPQRQVLEIAKAARRGNRILVLDEANSALSGALNDWFLSIATRMANDGAIVLFVSHRLGEIRSIADVVTVLRGGASIRDFNPVDASDDAMIEAMVGVAVHQAAPLLRQAVSSDEEPLLRVDGLVPRGTQAPGISFQLRRGEVVGLAGIDGNGQLEVIQSLAGVRGFSGDVTLRGQRYAPSVPTDAIRRGIGFVPADRQNEGLLTAWPIRENISLSMLQRLTNRSGLINVRKERDVAIRMAKRMSLPYQRIEESTDTLSGGNQQRVLIARVLATDPDIVVLYDGTRGVDVVTRLGILRELRAVAADGKAVLFYSSDVSEYTAVADRVLVMSRGKIVGSISGENVTEEEIIRVAVTGQAALTEMEMDR